MVGKGGYGWKVWMSSLAMSDAIEWNGGWLSCSTPQSNPLFEHDGGPKDHGV